MHKDEMVSATANVERGKRLEDFLKKKYPDMSWRGRSHALEINDSTVIGWRKGREIGGDGLARLHERGCDLYWLLTGNRGDSVATAVPQSKLTLYLRGGKILEALQSYHNAFIAGELTEEQYKDIIDATTRALKKARERQGIGGVEEKVG